MIVAVSVLALFACSGFCVVQKLLKLHDDELKDIRDRLKHLEDTYRLVFCETFPDGLRQVTASGKDDKQRYPTLADQKRADAMLAERERDENRD